MHRPRDDTSKMRENADSLKCGRIDRPAPIGADEKPDEGAEKRNVDRGNSEFNAFEHLGLQKGRRKRGGKQ